MENYLVIFNIHLFDRAERQLFESRLYVVLVNNVILKLRRRVTYTISLYELTNVNQLLFICFKLVRKLLKFCYVKNLKLTNK